MSLDVGCQRVYSTNKCERKFQKQDGICPYFLWQRREKGSVKNELMTGRGKKKKQKYYENIFIPLSSWTGLPEV